MEQLILSVKRIVEKIAASEKKRRKLAEFVRELPPSMKITKRIEPTPLKDIRIAGVDGGLVKKSLHGMDCMLVRAAAACFHYKEGKVEKVEYFPSRNPTPRPEIYEALSEAEWNQFSSLNRLKEEIDVALRCIDQLQPNMLLLDGLLLPHYLDKPASSSPLAPLYQQLLHSYKTLFSHAIKSKVALAGVVEDSRGTVFCDFLATELLSRVSHGMVPELKTLLKKTRDSNLLYLVLERGERTLPFPSGHPTITEGMPRIQSFSLKTAQYDRPLKIEFLPQTVTINELAGVLLSISGHHSSYGLPAPLIEADNVAKLSELDIENLYSNILSLAGGLPSFLKLRREQRPF